MLRISVRKIHGKPMILFFVLKFFLHFSKYLRQNDLKLEQLLIDMLKFPREVIWSIPNSVSNRITTGSHLVAVDQHSRPSPSHGKGVGAAGKSTGRSVGLTVNCDGQIVKTKYRAQVCRPT